MKKKCKKTDSEEAFQWQCWDSNTLYGENNALMRGLLTQNYTGICPNDTGDIKFEHFLFLKYKTPGPCSMPGER